MPAFASLRLCAFAFLSFIVSCTSPPAFWQTDALVTGSPQYDSSRLLYDAPLSHLKLEFLKTEKGTSGYLFLDQFRFTLSTPDSPSMDVFFTIGETLLKESIYLREGRMRLKLSAELTERILSALQKGQQVAIVADAFKETIEPDSFQTAFAKFLKGTEPLNFIKGPLQ
ncbi:MAG TPA: hypothetical protein VHL30_00135 [Chlamydiales bacterium]|jgi:hypothetical protein|nr:hypothetical protein [Chlamydiales bacterium]